MKRLWTPLLIVTALAAAAGLIAAGSAAQDKPAAAPAASASTRPAPAPALPEGWKLLYSQTFDDSKSVEQFEFTSPEKWKWAALDAGGCLESLGTGKYKTKVRSPFVIALLRDRIFEDFILDVDLLQTGKEYGHRDLCLFFGFTDPSKYYYVHLATKADQNAHNVFIVNDKPRKNIAAKTTKGIDWGQNVWHHVRVERRPAAGTIKVYFDDMAAPIMEAEDKTFPSGAIGVGSFDDLGRYDNLRIWGPKVVEKKAEFFAAPPPAGKPAADAGK